MAVSSRRAIGAAVLAALAGWMAPASAQTTHYRFGYEQPATTGFGIVADVFAATLAKASHGTMVIDQFPNSQLGGEPQLLQLVRNGDVDFIVVSTANSATLSPESGVLSLHYLFRNEAQLQHAVADPAVVHAVRQMFEDTVQGAHVLALATLGLRHVYGNREIHRVEDLKGLKMRVQATATEDTLWAAYGAQTVHMPFGSVYTSLQTGVVQLAENGLNVYDENKHYEVAPIVSLTNHEANNSVLWVSDKVWRSLSEEQKGWVQQAADEVGRTEPARAIELEHKSLAKLRKVGVKVIDNVDTSGFIKIAMPIEDQIAAKLGPHAVEILRLCRAVPE
ncbi:MAG: TRAP transporter substrate-binding protein [Acetobacteraceae bacterium]